MKKSKSTYKTSIWKLRFAAILLPVIFLIVIELLLRLFGYGYNTKLFLESPEHKGLLYNNPEIARRFFPNEQDAALSYTEYFRKRKPDNVFRIFVLGESSALGFPYIKNGSFHRMLKYKLSHTLPELDFEVINLSITAVNSYTLASFTHEIIAQKPDAILIYAGHNEYYGALGVGSTQSFGINKHIIKTAIWLKKFKTVQLAFNAYYKMVGIFKKEYSKKELGRMYKMVKNKEIEFGSKLFQKGISQFSANLDGMLSDYQKHNIPVFLSTIASNESGQKPFVSVLQNTTDSARYLQKFRASLNNYETGNFELALKGFSDLVKLDSTYAQSWYLLGKTMLYQDDIVGAKTAFKNSKEFDALRFRAPEAINNTIRKMAGNFNKVTLVDSKSAFDSLTFNCNPLNSLFADHLHPNLQGYHLIAEIFYKSIISSKILNVNDEYAITSPGWAAMPVTKVDSIFGELAVMYLKESWPFFEPMDLKNKRKYTVEEKLAGELLFDKITWDKAMNTLFTEYYSTQEYYKALKVMEGFALEYPFDYEVFSKTGNLAFEAGYPYIALFYLKKAYQLKPDVETAKNIVTCLMKTDNLTEALLYLNFIARSESYRQMAVTLTGRINEIQELKKKVDEELGEIPDLIKLSQFYLNLGNHEKAEHYFNVAFSMDPKHKNVLDFQKKLDLNKSELMQKANI